LFQGFVVTCAVLEKHFVLTRHLNLSCKPHQVVEISAVGFTFAEANGVLVGPRRARHARTGACFRLRF